MTRVRTASALVAAAAAVALGPRGGFADEGEAAAAAPPCPPAARLRGDGELARLVGLELAVLGVFSRDIPPLCPSVEVSLTTAGEQVSVALRDPSGRRAQQVVTNPHVAAIWIESWVHPELGAPLLAGRGLLSIGPLRAVAPGPALIAGQRTAAPSSPSPPTDRAMRFAGFVVGAAAEKLYASDDSEWRALTMSACARWGPLCAGLVGHLGDNQDFPPPSSPWIQLDRLGVDLLASLSAPFEVGRMEISPGIGFGMGLLRSSTGTCENGDPAGDVVACGDYPVVSYSLGPRAEMGLAGAFPISSRVSLLVTASVGFAPMARSAALTPGGDVPSPPSGPDEPPPNPDGSTGDGSPGDGGTDDDPATGNDGQPIEPLVLALPAEPNQFTRIGVGLVVALP
ncbi:MAG TPA: hypothetical protein VK698_26715 [Kofleriaceae bacterium]|nr:hypothetical protein [Kofleriaceae bacterium]